MIGVDRSMLSKIETGKMNYNQQFLEAAADAYNCSPVDILMRDPTDPEGIWSLWEHAKPGERKQMVDVLRVIVGGRTGTEG